jgi:hypothetical protein
VIRRRQIGRQSTFSLAEFDSQASTLPGDHLNRPKPARFDPMQDRLLRPPKPGRGVLQTHPSSWRIRNDPLLELIRDPDSPWRSSQDLPRFDASFPCPAADGI